MSRLTQYIQAENPNNFNVAVDYAHLVMKHLINIYDYETISQSGTLDLPSEFILTEDIIESAKLKALRRFIDELGKLLSNTLFAIKTTEVKCRLIAFKEELKKLKKLLPYAETASTNLNHKKIIHIVPEYFNPILEEVTRIKEESLFYLNKSDLIFMFSDDADPDELIKKIKEDVIQSG